MDTYTRVNAKTLMFNNVIANCWLLLLLARYRYIFTSPAPPFNMPSAEIMSKMTGREYLFPFTWPTPGPLAFAKPYGRSNCSASCEGANLFIR